MMLVVPLVAPLALLEQWKREIETFVEADVFKILIYHGPGRTKNPSTIQHADVVLTTYQVWNLCAPIIIYLFCFRPSLWNGQTN
jgi:SNF2 family DNA or RNA helicase